MERCINCGGVAQYLGTLGKVWWFRCEDCGLDQGRERSAKGEPDEPVCDCDGCDPDFCYRLEVA